MFQYILVLGGPLEGDKPSPLLQQRLVKAAELYREQGGKVVLSGGTKFPTMPCSEARVMLRAITELGVPEEDVVLEEQAKTTLENFKYTREIVGEDASVCYVTSKFHIYRSKLIMKKAGVDYTPISSPNGDKSLSFRVREALLIPLAKVGIIW